MKFAAVAFLTAILIAGFGNCSKVQAQDLVSPNLVYMTTNPWQGPAGSNPGSWTTNFTQTTSNGGGLSGGSQPAYNTTTGTFMFGYSQATIAYTYALSQALKDSGMTWTGYNYSWDYINQDMTRGNLSANLSFNALNGTSLYSKSWTLGPTTGGWTTMSGTENFTSPGLAAANLANFKLSFTGKDDRFWAGYYGPQVRNPSLTVNYTFDACSSNPLSSPTCPGYAAAYLTQQCTANPLYDSACPGYAQALLTQQCNADQLSNPQCPGYASAYLTYQCNQNPLYSSTCPGYETAYFDQQCSLNPLYSSRCSGYASAYKTQQCSINPLYDSSCTGYATAYHDQQCSINPLSYSDCPGYASAYLTQQCSANSLYSTQCPGYAQAYFDQQCKLNGLYDTKCPNYSTAYATKMVLEQQGMASTVATAGVVASTAPTTTSTTVDSTSGTVSTTPSSTGSTTVDKVITPTTTTANSAAAPAAAVQLVPPQPSQGSPSAPQQQAQEKKPEGGQQQAGGGGPQPQQQQQGGADKPKSARQELAERRQEAAKKEAVEKGKNLANDMGKAADMESQKQVQNVVLQAMAFVPGFDAYGRATVPDAKGYKPFTVYNGQTNVDNRRLGLGLYGPSDRLHNDLIESQYNRGN